MRPVAPLQRRLRQLHHARSSILPTASSHQAFRRPPVPYRTRQWNRLVSRTLKAVLADLPEDAATSGQEIPHVPELSQWQDVVCFLEGNAERQAGVTQGWVDALAGSVRCPLDSLSMPDTIRLFSALAELKCKPPQAWLQHLEQKVQGGLRPDEIASIIWSLAELDCVPSDAWLTAMLAAARQLLSEFLAPDLSRLVCAVATLDASPPPGWTRDAVEEATFQLREFGADFSAMDVARLASGMAKLLQEPDEEFREAALAVATAKTRTMEERSAVDFALGQLRVGTRTLATDPRWTHEELNWLPRRERDKRRIMKDNWERTQWQGWK